MNIKTPASKRADIFREKIMPSELVFAAAQKQVKTKTKVKYFILTFTFIP